uniref:Uncharacterized protein n=1 Tax=Romanomermis culicivorax TaxID=13658 RepID=A0A915KVX6_ROMCU
MCGNYGDDRSIGKSESMRPGSIKNCCKMAFMQKNSSHWANKRRAVERAFKVEPQSGTGDFCKTLNKTTINELSKEEPLIIAESPGVYENDTIIISLSSFRELAESVKHKSLDLTNRKK